jgi:hypothetical protein
MATKSASMHDCCCAKMFLIATRLFLLLGTGEYAALKEMGWTGLVPEAAGLR